MVIGNTVVLDEGAVFRSLRKDNLTFNEVFDEILAFIRADTNSSYRISIGSDSQVGKGTVIVSCIHVHRIGRGAIGFLHKCSMPRAVKSLREKIYLETCCSLQLAYLFNEERIKTITDMLGKKVSFEFHIDIGTQGKTKSLINEMTAMVKGLDFVPKIKPDSYCASCFADRYTKAM